MPRSTLLGRLNPFAAVSRVSPWPASPPSPAAWPPRPPPQPPPCGTASPPARAAATGRSTPATATTAACSSPHHLERLRRRPYALARRPRQQGRADHHRPEGPRFAGPRRLAGLRRPRRPDPRQRRRRRVRGSTTQACLAVPPRGRHSGPQSHRAGSSSTASAVRRPTRAIERWVGGSVNGSLSRSDVKALQRKVGSTPDGAIGPGPSAPSRRRSAPSQNGSHSWTAPPVRSLQRTSTATADRRAATPARTWSAAVCPERNSLYAAGAPCARGILHVWPRPRPAWPGTIVAWPPRVDRAAVAQLAAHLSCKQGVGGSSPPAGSQVLNVAMAREGLVRQKPQPSPIARSSCSTATLCCSTSSFSWRSWGRGS